MVRTMVCVLLAATSCSPATRVAETPRRPAPTQLALAAPVPESSAAAAEPAAAPLVAADPGPFWLDDGGAPVVVYPPKDRSRPQPVTVFLHGMCDTPDNECPWIAPAATEHGWLVCPRASLACQGGGAAWSFTHAERTVESAVERLVAARGRDVDPRSRTLMGFSLGGTVAMNLAQAGHGRWAHLVIIAAQVAPDKRRLDRSGVQSAVFAAGDYDLTHGLLLKAARRLDRAGFPAMFLSLGKVGHTFPDDMEDKMHAALGWLDAGI